MPRGSREGTMPSYWIVKTEPSTYSYDDLAGQKTAVWDGVKNNLALKHLRQMNPGDRVLVYHTGDEKAVVGVAEVTSEAYPDPKQKDPKLAVVDLRAVGRLPGDPRQPASGPSAWGRDRLRTSPQPRPPRLSRRRCDRPAPGRRGSSGANASAPGCS